MYFIYTYTYRIEGEANEKPHSYSDEELSEFIDVAFKSMDKNNDGLIDFAEYRHSQEDDPK